MATTTIICNSFKDELFLGIHIFGTTGSAGVYKMALFSSSAALSKNTTAYSTSSEVVGGNYSAGGVTLSNVANNAAGSNSDIASVDWENAVFTNITQNTPGPRYALLYNSSKNNRAVAVLDFGADQPVTAADFTVTIPSTGIGAIRIGP